MGFGAPLGPGQVAFAIPGRARTGVGGALRARVDVIAVPKLAQDVGLKRRPAVGRRPRPGSRRLTTRTPEGKPLTEESAWDNGRVVTPP